jgi:8-oxo-dGTP pyrophosphatase MutT (NUDIX family)
MPTDEHLPHGSAKETPPSPRHPIVFHQSAGAVVMIDARCLILRRADRAEWIFPKGHLELGEGPEDAAVREVREETGLEIEILGDLGSTRYAFGRRGEQHKRVDWFLARSVGGNLRLETLFRESALLDAAEAQTVLTHAADREVAARAFALAGGER